MYFDQNFKLEVCLIDNESVLFLGLIDKSVGSGNGLVLNRQHVITRTDEGQVL